MVNREWITVADAASLMSLSKRQAARRLAVLDAELAGRLLRPIGRKVMPGGEQPSKVLVSVTILREAMRSDHAERDIQAMRLEIVTIQHQLAAIRRALGALREASAGTERDVTRHP